MKFVKNNKFVILIIAIMSIVIFGFALSPKELQNDTFYTIKIGEYIMNNGIGDLTHDPFSWHDLSYTFPHWLYDTIIYNIYNWFGMDGLYFSTIVLTCVLGFTLLFVSYKKSKNIVLSLIFTLIAMYGLQPYLAVRAQLVSFIVFAITPYFIEKFLENKKKKYVFILIFNAILIANIHLAVWPFYFVLFLPYIGEFFLALNVFDLDLSLRLKIIYNKFFNKKNKEEKIIELHKKITENKERRIQNSKNPYKVRIIRNNTTFKLLMIIIVLLFTGLLTPTGDTPYTYLTKTVAGNTTTVINEHLPLTLVEAPLFAFSIIAFLAILTFTDSKIRLSDLFFFLGLTYLSFRTRRQISMFIIICYPILVKLLNNVIEKHDKDFKNKLLEVFTSYIGSLVFLGLVIILGLYLYKPQVNAKYVNQESYPVEASKWINENLDVKNIHLFNEYNYGSYLLYENIPVMIDSRADLYAPEFNTKTGDPKDGQDIFMDVQNVVTLYEDYEKVFKKYDITHVILYRNAKLAVSLRKDKNYKQIYHDNYFVIFERLKNDIKE